MSVDQLAHFVTDLIAVWNAHDLDRVAEFYAPDYAGVDVAQAAPVYGPEGARDTMVNYLRAFPDLKFTEDEVVIQGNRVVLVWRGYGTHLGKLMNIPATGRMIEVRGVTLLTIENYRVQYSLYIWDVAGLLRSLGLLPEL